MEVQAVDVLPVPVQVQQHAVHLLLVLAPHGDAAQSLSS